MLFLDAFPAPSPAPTGFTHFNASPTPFPTSRLMSQPERSHNAGPPLDCGTSKYHDIELGSGDDCKPISRPQPAAKLQTTSMPAKHNRPKKIPPTLIEGFLNGEKNPVSALMEYSAMSRLATTFQECPPIDPSIGFRFVIALYPVCL